MHYTSIIPMHDNVDVWDQMVYLANEGANKPGKLKFLKN
jgi:hypothetical protein